MIDNIKCKVDYLPWNDEPNLYFRVNTFNGKHYRLNLVFTEYTPPALQADFNIECDGITTPHNVLQAILDACWEYGLRPTGFKHIADETNAIKNHLEDMRKIVMNSKAVNWK